MTRGFIVGMQPPSEPLTDEEFHTLTGFLASVDTALDIERFDGFLCALVSGPDLVMPSEYWPIVLGCDPGEKEIFSSMEQAQEIMSLVTKHWNSIATTLHAGEIYYPILIEDDEGISRGNDWAEGFLVGLALRKESWEALLQDEDEAGAILPILALAHEGHPDPSRRFESPTPKERKELLATMIAGLVRIHGYFKARRMPLPEPTAFVRLEPKIGRNEPCPCGSGKKYKHCCLKKAH